MTPADLFDDMGVLDNENDFSEGGSDEARGLLAINMALRSCLTLASTYGKVLSTARDTIKTEPLIEFTNKPAELLRQDSLWAIDLSTKLPKYQITPIQETGGHQPSVPWPFSWTNILTNGQPWQYYDDVQRWYWRPIPDQIYTQRVYGCWLPSQVKMGDRKVPIDLPGRAAAVLQLPLASFAMRYLTLGIDDSIDVLDKIAQETFGPALKNLQRGDRSRAQPRVYSANHTT